MEAFLAGNPYFSAGFGLIGVGAGLAVLRTGGLQLVTLARRRMLVTVEIPSKDPSYAWFLKWASVKVATTGPTAGSTMGSKPGSGSGGGSVHRLLSKAFFSNQLSVGTIFTRRESGPRSPPGRHFVHHKGAWLLIERAREKSIWCLIAIVIQLDLKTGSPWETVTVSALARDKHLLIEILEDAKSAALAEEEGKTVIYTSYGPEWRPFGAPRRKRDIQLVVLDEGISDYLVADVKRFLRNGKWYHERGIPYRRGYLLFGPPGSGKTSFIQALAGHLDYNICVMNLSERGMTDDRLAHLLTNAPPRSLILLEDIDAAFTKHRDHAKEGYNDRNSARNSKRPLPDSNLWSHSAASSMPSTASQPPKSASSL
ncbi:BCS1 N terminal-domain-containing protein [Chytriomyces sp. MP71]|nr:BCS1 N terminal-domain-containing protein [Chytriomyces sp. MP71]